MTPPRWGWFLLSTELVLTGITVLLTVLLVTSYGNYRERVGAEYGSTVALHAIERLDVLDSAMRRSGCILVDRQTKMVCSRMLP
jgi:hypothetical protein